LERKEGIVVAKANEQTEKSLSLQFFSILSNGQKLIAQIPFTSATVTMDSKTFTGVALGIAIGVGVASVVNAKCKRQERDLCYEEAISVQVNGYCQVEGIRKAKR